nr:hypothetical protein [Tanacetum cinerariifolium]
METKYTLSSCSNSKAQQMQQIQDKAKKSCMAIPEFHDTLIQHLESVKKSIDERAQHKREYDRWVNERHRPIYDEEPMAEVQTTAEINVFAIGQHHTEQPEFNNEGKITRANTIEHTTSLIATNDKLKAQLQEKGFEIATLKSELRKSTENSVNTKFAKSSILGKPMLQSHRNQSVVRQMTAFKSERPRISKPLCDSQVDVNYDLSKPVTTHYFPKEREAAFAKPHHMIASSNSRISSKNMPRFSSNDMVHNHYLEEAKKKTQEHNRNSRIDSCVTKFLKDVNSRAKVPSNKTTNRNKPVEQISVAKKPERQIPKGHRFSIQKTFVVQKKTMTPRSCLRWQPTGKIFKTVGLRWVPTGKIFASNTQG